MKMARAEAPPLRQRIGIGSPERFFWDRTAHTDIAKLASGTSLGCRLEELTGRSVLLATSSQLNTALSLIELDGLARRLTILPPDADPDHFSAVVAGAEIDAIVIDRGSPGSAAFDLPVRLACAPDIEAAAQLPPALLQTEWVMLTSGT